MHVVAQSPGSGGAASLLGATMPAPRPGERVRWSRFLPATRAEGPGVRAVVWLQGCAVRCPGCFNPQLWADRGAVVSDTHALTEEWISRARSAGAEGLTLLGGEPFDQAAAMAVTAEAFRESGLTVMTFTGYPLERLVRWSRTRPDIARLLQATDLLCDGPFLRGLPDTRRPWVGSRNQGIRALTDAYAEEVGRIATDGGHDRLEVRIARDGTVAVNGWATDAALAALLDDLGVRADRPGDPRKNATAARSADTTRTRAEIAR